MKIVCDFNETLVLERFLPRWCRTTMNTGGLVTRVRAIARCGLFGAVSLTADRLGADELATRTGFRVLRGVPVSTLEEWAEKTLRPNPRAHELLLKLTREGHRAELTVVSRGTPRIAIDAYLAGPETQKLLWQLSLAAPVTVVAPDLEVTDGRLTGAIRGRFMAKAERAELLDADAVYVGDRRDRAWIDKLENHSTRFEHV